MIKKICKLCGRRFEVFKYREKTAFYCSKKCETDRRKGIKLTDQHRRKISIGIKNNLPSTAYKKGFRPSIKTEFKPGMIPWNKNLKFPNKTNEGNTNWRGDKVGYCGLHKWIRRHKGAPVKCLNCGSIKNLHWANKDFFYKRDLDDFMPLCASCHKKYDLNHPRRLVYKKLSH